MTDEAGNDHGENNPSIADMSTEEIDEVASMTELELGMVSTNGTMHLQLDYLGSAVEDPQFIIPSFGRPHPDLIRRRGGDPDTLSPDWDS